MDDSGILIRTSTDGGANVVRVSGELTIASAGQLRQALGAALEQGGHTVLDLTALAAADLSGLQLLYSARRGWSQTEGQVEFAGVPQWLRTMAAQAGCKPLRGEASPGGCINGEDDTHGR
ncbi:MAG: STAS domain-containing protein [Acidobacteria bacterium]|nr:STAS domain-containing protein [Acidobacteriota bacterium]